MKTVKEKLGLLREKMKQTDIQAYIICTQDFHGSEYVGDYFKEREYISGFTGSAGTLVITKEDAALWTDGRYFLQAESELDKSTIKLMKMFQEGVPTIEDYLFEKLSPENKIGFDGRTVSISFSESLYKKVSQKNITFVYDIDLVDEIWNERPEISKKPVWKLDEKYAGMNAAKKILMVREKLKELKKDILVLSALDEIAWLLNLRGNDVLCNPVFLSYMLLSEEKIILYAEKSIFNKDILVYLSKLDISLKPYNEFYDDLRKINKDKNVLLDFKHSNYYIKMCIPEYVHVSDEQSPITLMKSIKNKKEYLNEKKAHIKDGVAVTKFMFWLQKNIGKIKITELSAAEKLEEFRSEQTGYLGASFTPIMAFAEHGAIVHYSPTKESDTVLCARSFLLSDTGGHYYEGSTDITRTFPLGELKDEEKKAYTLVLVGNLRLGSAKFPYGMTGTQLDALAREPLWKYGMDYNHGTGHGVGYILNVHEEPNGISWQMKNNRNAYAVFEEGMITSNEPGFYCEQKFGIRHENLILCIKDNETKYGKFMKFETLTMVPFDWDAIDIDYMTENDINELNKYHKEVYENISPYLDEEERKWLKEKTRERRYNKGY